MNFIMMPEHVKQITCMKLSPSKKFLIVAEQHKNNHSCYISVYDMKDNCFYAHKHYNVSELIDGRGNTYLPGQLISNSNNPTNASAMGATGGLSQGDVTGGSLNRSTDQNRKPKIIVDLNFSLTNSN